MSAPQPSLEKLRVAIVHDWLIGGGAERVVLELHRLFPDAPIYTSYCTDEWRLRLDGKVVTGWLQHWPFSKLYKFLPVFRIWWFTHLQFDDYDLVISSSGNGEAKGVKVPKGTKHICYCHAPTHFYWRHYRKYLAQPKSGALNPLARLGLRLLIGPLRKWDYQAAQRPDYFIANSTHTKHDIKKYYDRDATVIFPPVDVQRFQDARLTVQDSARTGFVTVGRQVPYKYQEIIVEACTELGVPLTVVGDGPEHERLVKLAGPTVTFDNTASDAAVVRYMASAEAFIFAAEEDFGITPVEALAAGTPVIAYKGGGSLDYVIEGKNGLFFSEQTKEALAKTLQSFRPDMFHSQEVKKSAERFSTQAFTDNVQNFLSQLLT